MAKSIVSSDAAISTPPSAGASAARPVTKRRLEQRRPSRASQRRALSINLSSRELRELMTEQCRDGRGGYLTIYRGTRPELVGAGVPDTVFPSDKKETEFKFGVPRAGETHMMTGVVRWLGDTGYELEVQWAGLCPRMLDAAHPAVSELARMLLKDICYWTQSKPALSGMEYCLEHAVDMVADDQRAVDYKPGAGAPRLQVTPEFNDGLIRHAMHMFEWVHSNCEVMPIATASNVSGTRATLRLVQGSAANHDHGR